MVGGFVTSMFFLFQNGAGASSIRCRTGLTYNETYHELLVISHREI
jgi:hypothetical protein